LDKIQINDSTKRSQNGPQSHQQLAKLYINREILSECLETLDIFKEIIEDPAHKSKIIRDVTKALKLKAYGEDAIIYNKGETSTYIYMVIKGNVSLCMPIFK
jgi:signal-transduction protein with cAMP-binding, CBS, and nucleotidyltransferase domain